MAEFAVRRASEPDVPTVVALLRDLIGFHETLGGQDFRLAPGAEEEWHRYVASYLTEADRTCFVVGVEGRVVGFLLAEIRERPPEFMERRYGYVPDVYVERAYRSRGAGKALVEEALRWFADARVSRVRLQTDSRNVLGEKFWRRMGFHTTVLTMDRLL